MSFHITVLLFAVWLPVSGAAENHDAGARSRGRVATQPLTLLAPSERASEATLQQAARLVERLKGLHARISALPDIPDRNFGGDNTKRDTLDELHRTIKQLELGIACSDGNLARPAGRSPLNLMEVAATRIEARLQSAPYREERVRSNGWPGDYIYEGLAPFPFDVNHRFFHGDACATPVNPELDRHVEEACRKWGGQEIFADPAHTGKLCHGSTSTGYATRLCYDHAMNVVRTLSRPDRPMPGRACVEGCIVGQGDTCWENYISREWPSRRK